MQFRCQFLFSRRQFWQCALAISVVFSGSRYVTPGTAAEAEKTAVAIAPGEGKFVVTADGQPFAEVDYTTYAKPIIYPIYGPGQIPMTRNHPMRPGVAGEATDHPHHKSLWFAHGDVNGVSYWDERGKIITDKAEQIDAQTVRLHDRLLDPKSTEGEAVCRETVEIHFGATPQARWIDWDVTLHADQVPVKLGDTKEGTMALRVHPNLQLENDEKHGVTTANGRAINSEGITGGDVWGKRARWVDYWGEIEGHKVGIAFLDHPSNFRHPTYWHARTYGLFAANPFGLTSFVGPDQDGSHTIPAGESLRFRYRIVFHSGSAEEANVEQWFKEYAAAN